MTTTMSDQLVDALGWTPRQAETIRNADAVVNLWTGAVGSGKTVGSLWAFLLYIASAPRGGDLIVVGRTRDTIGRNVFGPLADPTVFGPFARHVHYNQGAQSGTIMGRKVYAIGASDVRSETVVRGLNCVGAYVDEITLISEDFWMQLQQRIRVDGVQIFATTNPDGPSHWVKRHIVDNAEANGHRVFQFTIHDNPHVSKDYYPRLMRELTGLWRRRMIDGEWCVAEGSIYSMWDPARHVVPAADIPPMERVLSLGIDYGSRNNTAGLLIGLAENRLWVLDEWSPPTATDGEYSVSLARWLGSRQPAEWRTPEWVFVDPAAASFKLQLRRDGMTNTRDGAHRVIPGLRTISSLLATDRIKVSAACVNLIREIPGYTWDPKATARGEDAPNKQAGNDHFCDALRYGVFSTRRLWRNSIPSALQDLTNDTDDDEEAA